MKLDSDLGAARDRYWDDQWQLVQNKRLVLVEGDDDAEVVSKVFDARRPTWRTKVAVVAAGGRARVFALLKDEQFGFGKSTDAALVDRDVWTDNDVAAQQSADRRVRVTGGWCLENLFLAPAFLRSEYSAIAEDVLAQRDAWVRAGALWWALQRAREAQQEWQTSLGWDYGRPHDALDLSSGAALGASLSTRIPADTRDAARLDIDSIVRSWEARYHNVCGRAEAEQWSVGVHGKAAYAALLRPALERQHGHLSPREWRDDLAGRLGCPAPLDEITAVLFP